MKTRDNFFFHESRWIFAIFGNSFSGQARRLENEYLHKYQRHFPKNRKNARLLQFPSKKVIVNIDYWTPISEILYFTWSAFSKCWNFRYTAETAYYLFIDDQIYLFMLIQTILIFNLANIYLGGASGTEYRKPYSGVAS